MILPGVEGRLERGVGGPRNTPWSSLGCTLEVHISANNPTRDSNQLSPFKKFEISHHKPM
jgi:hypothetical protein